MHGKKQQEPGERRASGVLEDAQAAMQTQTVVAWMARRGRTGERLCACAERARGRGRQTRCHSQGAVREWLMPLGPRMSGRGSGGRSRCRPCQPASHEQTPLSLGVP